MSLPFPKRKYHETGCPKTTNIKPPREYKCSLVEAFVFLSHDKAKSRVIRRRKATGPEQSRRTAGLPI